jgi:hypothetical protein
VFITAGPTMYTGWRDARCRMDTKGPATESSPFCVFSVFPAQLSVGTIYLPPCLLLKWEAELQCGILLTSRRGSLSAV